MKKLLIATAALCTALPFTFDGVTPTVSKAQAVVYRGIHRHVVVHRPFVRRPVLAAAAVGAAATGAGWGWGGWGWNRPLFAYGGTGAPLFAYGGNGMRVPEPPYTEAQMAAARYGCYPTSFDYSTHVCLPRVPR
jgi:hypothetical protein